MKLKYWAMIQSYKLVVVLLSAILPASGYAAGLNLTEEEKKWIDEHPALRVHNETVWAPFNFSEDGQPAGFSIDYMNLVAESAGLKVEYVTGPSWNQFLGLMKSGELDVMLNIVKTEDREKFLIFTDPYAITSPVLAAPENGPDKYTLLGLYGRTMCMPRGSSMNEYMEKNHKPINLLLLEDALSCLHAVADGRADVSLEGFSVVSHLLKDSPIPGIRVSDIDISAEIASVMRMATNVDQPVLRNILQKAMENLEDSEVASLRTKWLGVREVDESVSGLSMEQVQWIQDNPVIRVHNEMDWPPFNFNENGQPRGFSIDFMNLIASKVGLQVEYVSGPTWDQFIDMIQSDELDVMVNINRSTQRDEFLGFTDSYLETPAAVVTKDADLQLNSIEDLYGKRVASIKGFSTANYLAREHPQIELVLVDDTLDALYAVLEGRAVAMLDDLPVVEYLIKQHTLSSLSVVLITRDPGLASIHNIAVRKDWPVLRDILQQAKGSVSEQELSVLREKWIAKNELKETQESPSTTIAWLVGIALGIFILLISLNWISGYFFKNEKVVLQTGTRRFRILILAALSVFVGLVAILGWFALEQIREQILRDVGNNLEDVVSTTTQRLDMWVDERKNMLGQIVKNPILVSETIKLLNVPTDPETLKESPELSSVRAIFEQYKDATSLGFFVIDTDGYSVGSKRDSNLGLKNLIAVQRPELFARVLNGESVFIPPTYSNRAVSGQVRSASVFIAVPLKNDEGRIIAIVTARLNPEEGFSRVLQFSRVGESGESYAFSRDGTLISASRFEDDLRDIGLLAEGQSSVMNIQIRNPGGDMTKGYRSNIPTSELPFTHMANSAISIGKGSGGFIGSDRLLILKGMDGYRDYRGVPVLGAWLWNSSLGLGLASEIDVSEALSTFAIIRTLSIVLLGFTLVLSLGGTLFILRTSERTNKELRKARDELEDRVTERTAELRTSTERSNMILENATDGIMTIDDKQVITGFNPAAEEIWGYSASEVLGKEMTMLIPEYAREDHLKNIHSFRDAEAQGEVMESRGLKLFGLSKKGEIFPTDVGISKNEVDGNIYYSAFIRDITESQRAEQLIRLAQLIDRLSAEVAKADSFHDSLRIILTNAAKGLDWSVAHVYLANDTRDKLLPSDIWHLDESDKHEEFIKLTQKTEFSLGEGLPGRVAESGEPIWIENLAAEGNFPRNKLGEKLGLSSGFGFPVNVDGETLAVLEFYSVLPRDEEPEQLAMAVNLGKQVSGVLERNQMQEVVRERNSELESVSSMILRWRPDMTIVSMNQYGLDFFGYSKEDLEGCHMNKTLLRHSVEHTSQDEPPVDMLVENLAHSVDQNSHKDGSLSWIAWSNKPILDEEGEIKEILSIGQDMTAQKALEASLSDAKEVAESATKTKSDFLANMSHEIRTPMNAVIGLSDLCLRTDLDPKQKDYLTKIHRSAEALLGIINDILDFSKIEAGHLDMEEIEFEIDEVLHNLGTVSNVKTQEKGLELLFNRDLEIPMLLIGDPLRLGQILINLTNNAVKFTETGEIIVDIRLMENVDGRAKLKFIVRDTGIGMSRSQQEKLFKAFSQADASTTRKYGGTGLGLSISKQLVELMDGKIWVESEPGVGSEFIFTVSLGIAEGSAAKTFRTIPDLQDKRALVVDDNAIAREIVSTYLGAFTFIVDEAANSDEAIKLIESKENEYDLIVLDWLMPGMSGLELAEKIKTGMELKIDPHLIMISAFSPDDLHGKPGGDYIDRIISKPISPSDLFDAVLETFGHETRKHTRQVGDEFDIRELRPVQGAEILLVEDNEINQQVASEILEQAGFYVDIANHGQEALDMLTGKTYDCVLMDVQMPVMDGYTATGKIRKNPAYKDLPVLAMTANATHEDRDRSIEAGMDEHIAKPIRPQILFEALLKWIPHGERDLPASFQAAAEDTDTKDGSAAPIPSIEGIDVVSSVERLGGNIESYRRLLEKFLDNQADAAREYDNQIRSNDLKAAERTAHTLKGVAALIGAEKLKELSATLEAAARDNKMEELNEEVEEAGAELTLVSERFQAYLQESVRAPETSSEEELSPEELKEKMAQLKEKLEAFDAEAEDDLREIIQGVGASAITSQLKSMAKLLDKYDFEGGLVIVDEVLNTLSA